MYSERCVGGVKSLLPRKCTLNKRVSGQEIKATPSLWVYVPGGGLDTPHSVRDKCVSSWWWWCWLVRPLLPHLWPTEKEGDDKEEHSFRMSGVFHGKWEVKFNLKHAPRTEIQVGAGARGGSEKVMCEPGGWVGGRLCDRKDYYRTQNRITSRFAILYLIIFKQYNCQDSSSSSPSPPTPLSLSLRFSVALNGTDLCQSESERGI